MSASEVGAPRFRIASITVRQFRGVAKERTYAFDGRPGLLYGNNGVGKSTVALALQWILYGRFHGDVLPNVRLDSFLAPVQGKGKAFAGEVVLVRGCERLVISRDSAASGFTLRLGEETWSGEEAEAKRDAILGLDMDTFVRAVLLQQSWIRGLLLDEPKERNKALDRLLGMDALEHLLELARPKPFLDAARAWREAIRSEQQALEANEKLLQQQLEHAQRVARELKFLNKDLNPHGLKARYEEVARGLVALGEKYGVAVAPLPPCEKAAQAGAASKAFANGLRTIRLGAEPQRRLASVERAIGSLSAAREACVEAAEARAAASSALASLVKERGEAKALLHAKAEAQERTQALRRELKEADELRQLLEDAARHVKQSGSTDCPVCERPLSERVDLATRLRERAGAMATQRMERLQQAIEQGAARIRDIDAALDELARAEKALELARKGAERAAARGAAVLGAAVPENKVLGRLDEALSAKRAEDEKLSQAIQAMEADLEALDGGERQIRAALVPAVEKRGELEAHEARMGEAKERHAGSVARAVAMEALATQLESIRRALLAAKQDLATELLHRSVPRAQALYRKLVRQPVFETLDIQANARAAKVDYTFQVVAANGAARDARLVLSDGQLTATALALFFGLAESTAHALDLLYVDDPTQNLDLPCKEAMAKVVAEMARRRQVIVATQDEDFVSFLKSEGFPDHGVVHHIKGWDGNPTVETSVPAALP